MPITRNRRRDRSTFWLIRPKHSLPTLDLFNGGSPSHAATSRAFLNCLDAFCRATVRSRSPFATLALMLAQVWDPAGPDGPHWLFLDEPVSSFDIGHQLEVMLLMAECARAGDGVVAVMHGLNLTAMYTDRVILLSEGHYNASGAPVSALTVALLRQAYECKQRRNSAPSAPATYILPHMACTMGCFQP